MIAVSRRGNLTEPRASYAGGRAASRTGQFLRAPREELLRRLAVGVLLVGRHLKVHQQRTRIKVLELICPEHRSTAVARPVAAIFTVLNELGNVCIRRPVARRLPERSQRWRVRKRLVRQRRGHEEEQGAHHVLRNRGVAGKAKENHGP